MGGKVPDHGLVFTREDGGLAHPDYVSGTFERLVKAAGGTRIRYHDLRHTHATILLALMDAPRLQQGTVPPSRSTRRSLPDFGVPTTTFMPRPRSMSSAVVMVCRTER